MHAMLISIPDVLTAEQVTQARQILEAADWVDGRVTAGHQGARVKDNQQIPAEHPAARQVGEMILRSLGQNPLFMSAALPLHVMPPFYNRYSGGQHFGTHVDGAIRQLPNAQSTAPISRPRSSWPGRRITTVANSAWRTPTA